MSSSSRLARLGFLKALKQFSHDRPRIQISFGSQFHRRICCNDLKFFGSSQIGRHGCCLPRRNLVRICAMDEDSDGMSSFDEWEDSEGISVGSSYMLSSSGEESDTELVINPIGDVDLPSISDRFDSSDRALAVTAHRFALLRRSHKTNRIQHGVMINMALIVFLTVLLSFVDWCSWRIVRLPLAPFFLTRPFFISTLLASGAGYLCIPLLDSLTICQAIRKESPVMHFSKKGTPTMGGLFFIPLGIAVAKFVVGFSSFEVRAAVAATLAFAAIGLFDDISSLVKNQNSGLPAWLKVVLEVAVGTWFSFWLGSSTISSPYHMKALVPLPALGLIYLGNLYPILTTFCFVSMGNGVNLTDGLDGLAGGTAALAFIGMSIAVLPICSDLSIFGASMAGACVGFLMHNRYKASVFMGDTGSLALGGALAAMAACTGMFFPLFISSGIFVVEASSVIMQVIYFKTTKYLYGSGRRLFRMTPLHHHFELCGLKEPLIVAITYVVSYILAMFAGYVGLISA